MTKNYKAISIVVPTRNEEANVVKLVERIDTILSKENIQYEVIFVDDHSEDRTQQTVLSVSQQYPVRLLIKQGKAGKAFSLFEGFEKAKYDVIAMLDADLQYPPEVIPAMMEKLATADVVVSNRKKYGDNKIRKFLNKGFRATFGKLLFGFSHDIQSGLKVFKKEVIQTAHFTPRSGWTFDLEFLYRAREAGYQITGVDIDFEKRTNGASKVGFLKTSLEIGTNALNVRMRKIHPQHIAPTGEKMSHAGIGFKRKKYVTHTTLHHSFSAIKTFTSVQKLFIVTMLGILMTGLYFSPLQSLQIVIALLSAIYFLDTIFNLFIVLKSLHTPQEIDITPEELAEIDEASLPTYSILCPLYKEAHIIPHFLNSIDKIDWPKNKLEVMLLLEEDDKDSIAKASSMNLPSYVRIVVVPDSQPKTKPKACNYGLSQAIGEYLVIYDAEDMPDPLQLKKAYLAFKKSPENVVCLQAKLNYYNPEQNLLTRFFTAEYSLWFDITLTGLQAVDTNIPLGGTSNHFRIQQLLSLRGWDPFNVTEDADLGMRLFKLGYKTAVINSTTLEEANSKVGNWFRQRSRWIKGYMQTYLVHTRKLLSFHKNHGLHAWYFHLVIGGKIAFILINPLLWVATISYFSLYAIVGPTIEALYPAYIFYMAAFSLVVGNFLFLYYYMIGCMKRGQWSIVKYTFLLPIYWLMISIAGGIALYQLMFKPHYWEKTVHGLHLLKKQKKSEKVSEAVVVTPKVIVEEPKEVKESVWKNLSTAYTSGTLLIAATIIANLLNFVFNSYLGRVIDLSYFSVVSLVGSFLYIVSVPVSALSSTVKYRSGYLVGRYGNASAFAFWKKIRFNVFLSGVVVAALWSACSYALSNYFHTDTLWPFLSFAPFIIASFVNSVDGGYLSGKLLFGSLAAITIAEPLLKLIIAFSLVSLKLPEYVYLSIPFSTVGAFLLGWLFVKLNQENKEHTASEHEIKYLPKKFFVASAISGLSMMSFLSLDIILATHFLSKKEAGMYALLSLSGKMIYFLGNLAGQFVAPLVSRHEGANTNSRKTFNIILLSTILLSAIGFVLFGVFASITLPILFGEKAKAIVPYAGIYAFGMFCFSVSRVYSSYYLIKKVYTFPILGFALAILQFVLVYLNHGSILSLIFAMYTVGALNLFLAFLFHVNITFVTSLERIAADFFGLFQAQSKTEEETNNKLRILIFNWRDTQHRFAGGAEVYIHEIAKRWVADGNAVTLFSGSDGHSPRSQTVDGVEVIRHGGTYLVYVWAFLYYLTNFRGRYDVIVDCENGIPFFTPLYSNRVIFLLVHHVHQAVFRQHMRFPFSKIAEILEGNVMPRVYKNKAVITVSESSRKALISLGVSKAREIHIVHNGINPSNYVTAVKTTYPLFTYLGRLKAYKNIDVAIQAFSLVSKTFPRARLAIIGEGENKKSLIKLVEKLNLSGKVSFYGKVSETKKIDMLGKSWAVVQPSMTEGWGITVIEANSCGTPVIASNVSGLKDSVVDGETGILVKVNDSNILSIAMEKIITDAAYREMLSKNAFVWAKNFNWDQSAEKFYKIIKMTWEENAYKSAKKIAFASK